MRSLLTRIALTLLWVCVVVLVTSCPFDLFPDDDDDQGHTNGTEEPFVFDASDGTHVEVESPVALTIAEEDPGGYPPGALTSIVRIEGTLAAGQTATISFSAGSAFGPTNRIAFNDVDWIPVPSTISPDGLTIHAVVDHLSAWTVVDVPEGDAEVAGEVRVVVEDAWLARHEEVFGWSELFISLVDADTGEYVPGASLVVPYGDLVFSEEVGDPRYDEASNVRYTAAYALPAAAGGVYTVFAGVDMNGDGEIGSDEPQNYAAGEPVTVAAGETTSGVDVVIGWSRLTGSVDADATDFPGGFGGEHVCAVLWVLDDDGRPWSAAYTNPPTPHRLGTSYPAPLELGTVPFGRYILGAFVDLNGDYDLTYNDPSAPNEPFGIWEENLAGGDPAEVWILEDHDTLALVIDTVVPEVELAEPAPESTVRDLVFDVAGTADDEDSLVGSEVYFALYHLSDIDTGQDPPAPFPGASPVYEDSAIVGMTNEWVVAGVDLTLEGEDDYAYYVEITDADDLTGSSYGWFTVYTGYLNEGEPLDQVPLTIGVPYVGQVGTGSSYYTFNAAPGVSYALILSDLTSMCVTARAYSSTDYTWALGTFEPGPADTLRLYGDPPGDGPVYLKVDGDACASGAAYTLTITEFTPFSVSGTVTVAPGTYPVPNEFFVAARIEGEYVGDTFEMEDVQGGDVIAYSVTGLEPDYMRIFAFIRSDDGMEASGEYPVGGTYIWMEEDRTGIDITVSP